MSISRRIARNRIDFARREEGGQGTQSCQPGEQWLVHHAEYHQLLAQKGQRSHGYYQQTISAPREQAEQPRTTTVLPSQSPAPEPPYHVDQAQCFATPVPGQLLEALPSHFTPVHQTPHFLPDYAEPDQPAQKKMRRESLVADHSGPHQCQDAFSQMRATVRNELTPHFYHAQQHLNRAMPRNSSYDHPGQYHSPETTTTFQPDSHAHHHHRLPTQPPIPTSPRTAQDNEASSPNNDSGAANVVGQAGMPAAAPRPKGPKLKFTPEDDALLIELKEGKNLTWKQIADFFPGRSSGTLQVRYCTKLKAKKAVWTDEMVARLRAAVEEYEADRWRAISGKVGNGFSAAACREKVLEMDGDGVSDSDGRDVE
ncbi:hypothetical protein MBLNU230_g7799t1 [Neophaeotheca triangularis]